MSSDNKKLSQTARKITESYELIFKELIESQNILEQLSISESIEGLEYDMIQNQIHDNRVAIESARNFCKT